MTFDFIILAAQAAFSPVRQSLYGVVMAIIYTVMLDKVLMLSTTRTEVKIISAKSDAVSYTHLDVYKRQVLAHHPVFAGYGAVRPADLHLCAHELPAHPMHPVRAQPSVE